MFFLPPFFSRPRPGSRSLRRRHGQMLMLAIGILAILSSMGFFFLVFSYSEQKLSRNWSDLLRTQWAARSGIEKAMVLLRRELLENKVLTPHSDFYFPGEDANRNGILDPGEDLNGNGILDTASVPLEEAPAVSFPAGTFEVEGKVQPISLWVSSDSPFQKIGVKLKVVDLSGQMNLNDSNSQWNRLLEVTAQTLSLPTVKKLEPLFPSHPDPFSSTKPPLTWNQIQNEVGAGTASILKNFFTLQGWQDPTVIRPQGLAKRHLLSMGEPVYNLTQLFPALPTLEKRTPLNINMAPLPLIQIALTGLKGMYVKEQDPVDTPHPTYQIGDYQQFHYTANDLAFGHVATLELSAEKASQIAHAIVERRNAGKPFQNWMDFRSFLESLPDVSPLEVDLILANANPNTDFNKFGLLPALDKRLDKSDLIHASTEFTFYPTGYFHIEALSFMTYASPGTRQSKLIDSVHAVATVKLFDVAVDTTQHDFAEGTILRDPAAEDLSEGGQTLSLLPEPSVGKLPQDCRWDGQLILAPRTGYDKLRRFGSDMTFYAALDHSLTPAQARGNPHPLADPPSPPSLFSPSPVVLTPLGVLLDGSSTASYPSKNNLSDGLLNLKPLMDLFCRRGNNSFQEPCMGAGILLKRPILYTRGTLEFWFLENPYAQKAPRLYTLFSVRKAVHPENKIFYVFNLYYHPTAVGAPYEQFNLSWTNSIFRDLQTTTGEGEWKTGQWNHLKAVWDTTGFKDFNYFIRNRERYKKANYYSLIRGLLMNQLVARLYLNGQEITQVNPSRFFLKSLLNFFRDSSTFSLGVSDTAPFWNAPALGLVDDLAIYKTARVLPSENPGTYEAGRFLHVPQATFTSRFFQVPNETITAVNAFVDAALPPASSYRGTLVFSILNGRHETLKRDSLPLAGPITLSPFRLEQRVTKVAYRLTFLSSNPQTPLYNTPVVDDIRLQLFTSPRFIEYHED